MDPLHISATEDTPEINFDPGKGIFEMSKRSLPENAIAFYKPVLEWLDNYTNSPNPDNFFDFKLEYFNTASAKQIAKVLLILEKLSKKSKLLVRWHYDEEDVDMLTSGKRYEKLIKINFEFLSFKNS